MARTGYPRISNPVDACRELMPYRRQLVGMMTKYRPYSPEYRAIQSALEGMSNSAKTKGATTSASPRRPSSLLIPVDPTLFGVPRRAS